MKLTAGVNLSLSPSELFHCVPLIGSDDGSHKETHTSSSWDFNAGIDLDIGLEGGWKDGHGILGTGIHIGFNVGGHKENGQQDINNAMSPVPTPNIGGSEFGSPNYPASSWQYHTQYDPQYQPNSSQLLQFGPQRPISPQSAQQLDYLKCYAQPAPQKYDPQRFQQYAPTPQYVTAQQNASEQQYAPLQQYAPGQPYASAQQNAPLQQYALGQQYVPLQQYAPVPQYALAQQYVSAPR